MRSRSSNCKRATSAQNLSHSTGGVVNAVIKSSGNQLHGDLFRYFRKDILDANDYFSNRNGVGRQEYRQNQFDGTVGGPVYIPKLYDGRNKTFFFVDYQGTRIIQPISSTSTVPTANIVNSGYTNLHDLTTDNSGTHTDGLGRIFSNGTVFDPATTRTLAAGAVDARTGFQNTSSNAIAVRDPFYNGNVVGIRDFTPLTANLNQLPANRLDPNAVHLLGLYPAANRAGFVNNYFPDAKSNQTVNTYDIRIDQNFNGHDTLFGVYSSSHRVLLQPGNLPGLADGQVFGNGTQDSPHYAIAVGYDHVFSSTLSNELRLGFNQNTDNVIPSEGNTPGIPEQFDITGVPNIAGNGGLPPIDIGGLANLGVATYIPTIRTIRSIEISDNLTKNVGTHSLKVGYQIVRIAGDITQPPFAKGFYTFSGQFTTVPNTLSQSTQINQTPASGITGISDLLLTPTASTVGGPSNVGGLSQFSGSNFASTNDLRYYMGAYFQDDWKATPNLTLNLGLRWDHTTPYAETNGRQANFQANGGNGPGGIFYLLSKTFNNPRSASFNTLTAQDGIAIQSTSLSTGTAQFTNFAPRLGFAYRIHARTVTRGGYGIAYGALANIGFGGTLGTNYPFLYSVGLTSPNSSSLIILPDGTTAALENSLAVENLGDPTSVNARGISLAGRQCNFQTPYSQTSNLTFQYQLDNHDAVQVGYVGTLGRHLDILGSHHSPSQALAPGANIFTAISFPDFSPNSAYESTNGSSNYNSLQAVYNRELSHGTFGGRKLHV